MNFLQNHFKRMFCALLLLAACFSAPALADTNLLDGDTTLEENNLAENDSLPDSTNASHASSAQLEPEKTTAASAQPAIQFEPISTNTTASMVRVLGMLAVVLGLFLGGVWLFRNWQRLTIQRGNAPKLNVLETRSLGGRHAIFVVGYENERFLIASSPAGINMLTHLHPGEETRTASVHPIAAQPSFAVTLAQMLKGKRS
jgi:flagellar biogenesis protein FliO